MKIESDQKLDFNNVLIRPKRSTISSRSQVNLERTFSFPHSTNTLDRYSYYFGKYGYNRDIWCI